MKLGMQVGLGPGHIVLDGDPATPPLKGHSPQFSAYVCFGHVYCGQTAGWIKMLLGTEVNVSSGNVVLDGVAASSPPKRGTAPHPVFGSCLLWPNSWMKMPLGTEVDLGPGHIVSDGDPALRERGRAAPLFSAHVYCGHGHPSQLLLSSC